MNTTLKFIIPVSLSVLGLGLLPTKQANSVEMIQQCTTTTIYGSGAGGPISWTSQTCWWEISGGGGFEGGSDYPFPVGGGHSGGSTTYSHNDFDTDGDNEMDCWKRLVADGDHYLDDGDDFGMRVLGGENDMHYGIDIQAPYGSIIRSPAYGVVIAVERTDTGLNGAYVRMRYIKNQTLYEAVMIHMVEESPNVDIGDVVYPGTPLGMVNSTGSSTGDHLHFQLYVIDTLLSPDGINPFTKKPYNYATLGPKTTINPVLKMGGLSCEINA